MTLFKCDNKGFTYIEILVSTAVVFFTLFFFIQLNNYNYKIRERSDEETKMSMVAQGVMDAYRELGKDGALAYAQGYTVDINEDTATGHAGLKKVTITVNSKVSGMSNIKFLSYHTTEGSEGGAPEGDITGSGTQEDPYIIWTLAGLDKVRDNLTAYYELGADIDASDTSSGSNTTNWNTSLGFKPIGINASNVFSGNFDGKGHEIQNLYINSNQYYVGLFGNVNGATIKNLQLSNCDLYTSLESIGLVGYVRGPVTISNVAISGNIRAQVRRVGSLVGIISTTTGVINISRCYSTANLTGDYCGGLIGVNVGNPNIVVDESYFSGTITSSGVKGSLYALSNQSVSVNGYYWDTGISNIASGPVGIALTTDRMKKQSSFEGWDFADAWGINPGINNCYPYLKMFGQGVETNITGKGTQSEPYIIWTLAGLDRVRDNLNAYYQLGCDINAAITTSWNSGKGWTPIGNSTTRFRGFFDGQGYKISKIYVNDSTLQNAGLFGAVGGEGYIRNLILQSPQITASTYVGGLCGSVFGTSSASRFTLEKCGVNGGDISGIGNSVGGVVGYSPNYSYIKECYNSATVSCSGSGNTGGIIGYCVNDQILEDCYNVGNISGGYSGGITGNSYIGTSTQQIVRCFNMGTIGSLKGALIGRNWGVAFVDCYFDNQTSGTANGVNIGVQGGTALSTIQSKLQSSYLNWDFVYTWSIDPMINNGYPHLQAFDY